MGDHASKTVFRLLNKRDGKYLVGTRYMEAGRYMVDVVDGVVWTTRRVKRMELGAKGNQSV